MSIVGWLLDRLILPKITEVWGMCDICDHMGWGGMISHEGSYVRMCKKCIKVVIGEVDYISHNAWVTNMHAPIPPAPPPPMPKGMSSQ